MTEDNHSITLYVKSTTPTRLPLGWMLARAEVDFVVIDLRVHPQAAADLAAINHGRTEVPALTFPDGQVLNRPTAFTLKKHLVRRGYDVSFAALLLGLSYDIAVIVGALAALAIIIASS